MPTISPWREMAREPFRIPATKQQPRKAMMRAASLRFVIFSFQIRAEKMTTKAGAVYSRMAATASEETCWL